MLVCRTVRVVTARSFAYFAYFAWSALAGAAALAQTTDRKPSKPVASPTNLQIVAVATPIAVAPAKTDAPDSLIALATADPNAVTRKAIERYQREVRDYRCVFTKQEFVGGKLRPAEEIEVLFRGRPHSVFMKWIRNADGARRALFIDQPQFVDGKGQKTARVEPNGALARLIVSEVSLPIHGKEAKEASRRTIDEFGFGATLMLLDRLNKIGAANGELDYRFDGEDRIDGRPTLRFVRHLPSERRPDLYPDSKLVVHIDQDWLLPTAVYAYADHAGTQLLGSYVYSQVRLNPGFTDRDFDF